ncbi:ATP-binding domain-containing protein [Enhygromyxa salina]|uniref:DNA 3'-5' helicase II n=1 Tax=Enhygromyxa salina TaxID=215803 RepID=A0A2S9Y8E5_9BACT|nr:ATP-binding domain-containing protein [Enhygromyxa salina]PRQ01296.1 Helicase IV [Enhygromyxa salina]
MNGKPAKVEVDRGERIQALCAAIWEQRASARCLGYLRVQTSGRTRELILGTQSLVTGGFALLDWEQAPLAEVFLADDVGDDYEVELDSERSVEGTVLARALLRTEDGRVTEVDDGVRCLRRASTGWVVGPTRQRSPISPRPTRAGQPGSGTTPSSIIEVELDATQRRAVELGPERSLLILGEAGFGKTTVALHRVAHLHRQARAAGRSFAALILVPTPGLRRLVVSLLDRLGVDDAEVRTFFRWIAEQGRAVFPDLPERDSQAAPLAVSRVKRHPAVREVLPEIVRGTAAMREVERGYRDHETINTAEQLLHLFGDRALLERVAELAGGAITPRMLRAVLDHTKVLFSPTSEHQLAHVDADRLRTIDGQSIDAGTPMQDAETIDVEDFAVLFELLRLRTGGDVTAAAGLSRYDHIVVDEAQEFAPIELAVIGRARADGGSITLAGDEHQQVDETIAFTSWPEMLSELGVGEDAEQITLAMSYRCPPAVEAFARTLFEPRPVDPDPAADDPALVFTHAAHELELVSLLIRALVDLRHHDQPASVAVVCRFAASARRMHTLLAKALSCRLVVDGDFRFGPGISVTCVDEIKGLEFDYVVLPDVSASNYPDTPEARRALYVAATRASARLWLLHHGRGSRLLPAAPLSP